MFSVNLEYFTTKTKFYQYPIRQKSNFYRRLPLLKKLYNICTDYYDINEYLAVKTLGFLPTISYYICNVMFTCEQKWWHEIEAIIPTYQ